MKKHIPLRNLRIGALTAVCIVSSFMLGVESAGEVETITPLGASSIQDTGDMGSPATIAEVIAILELTEGGSPHAGTYDRDGDGQVTVDDALMLLHSLTLR